MATSLPPERGQGERILFVDDELVLCQATGKLLARLGFRPTVHNSADEAWNAFSAAPQDYDVVITDLTMPKMTGIELAKRMLQTRPSLPIILTSGYSNQLTNEAVQELGIRELIVKPLDHVTLLRGIRRALETRAP